MTKVSQWSKSLNDLDRLCTPQFTHLPCVVAYLRARSGCDFGLVEVDAKDIPDNITMFCNASRKMHALKRKISLLEDLDA